MLLGWVAAAGAVAGIGGALIQGSAARSAANTQAGAAEQAQQIQQGEFNTVLGNEAPFLQQGTGAVNKLSDLLGTSGNTGAQGYGSLAQPFTAQNFQELSPAYQFQLQQGAQGTLNQGASSQGAESGAALSGLQSYNQQFANTSFNNAFNQYQQQQNNIFGRLNSLATLGQGAASNQATGASSFANSIGQSATNVGTALAAGQVGQANAFAGGLQSAVPWLASSGGGGGAGGISYNTQPGEDQFLNQDPSYLNLPGP
jgi:hypothetical protein